MGNAAVVTLLALVLSLHAPVALARASVDPSGTDLAKKYPATLDWSDGAPAREWTCEAGDVFALTSFKASWEIAGQKLTVTSGPAAAVFGQCQGNVVWAVVLPEKPGKVETTLAGNGDAVTSVFLRFNPALVGELFPAATVKGAGPEAAVWQARRIEGWKINACWQANNQPVIPWKTSVCVDLETQGGARRFFNLETKEKKLAYEPFFEKKPLPWLAPISKDDAFAAFDDVVAAFEKEYPKFVLHPEYDFTKAAAELRKKRVASAKTCFEVGAALAELLRPLDDLHIDVQVDQEWLPVGTRRRPINASWNGSQALIGKCQDTKKWLAYGRTRDDVGYLNVYALNEQELPKLFDAALEELGDCVALVVDLRFNGGGDELLAQQMAGRFVDQERVYSVNRYRSGPRHDDLGKWLERKVAPRGPWRFQSPVVCLQGQKTFSSAESMALMFAQCPQVTTMGDKTGGSSANPRFVETKGKIKVRLPRWDDRTPKQEVIEGKGVPPKVAVDSKESDFDDQHDPVLSKALATLRAEPEDERKPGKRK
jgi:hypothetical protein